MLTAVSLFAGIGGIDLALERAGVRVVAAVEIDPAARGVLADHFPNVALFNDVTEVTGDQLRAAGFVPDRGIVTAGWPCQDFSLAGRRLGLAGTRSGLWWHVVRLLAETRPCWFIGENVPGLLSTVCSCPGIGEHDGCAEPHQVPGGHCGPGRCMEIHGGAMGAVLGSLAELGYGFAYRVLDAQHFGVPQQRPRVVFVGRLGDRTAPVAVLLEPEGGEGDSAAGGAPRANAARVAALSASDGGADDNDATGGRLVVGTLMAGSPTSYRAGVDEAAAGGQGHNTNYVTHALTSEGADASEDGTGLGTPLVAEANAAVRRLTPLETERLQGLPDGWTATSRGKPQSDSARYREIGNSVAVSVFEWVAHRLVRVDAEVSG